MLRRQGCLSATIVCRASFWIQPATTLHQTACRAARASMRPLRARPTWHRARIVRQASFWPRLAMTVKTTACLATRVNSLHRLECRCALIVCRASIFHRLAATLHQTACHVARASTRVRQERQMQMRARIVGQASFWRLQLHLHLAQIAALAHILKSDRPNAFPVLRIQRLL